MRHTSVTRSLAAAAACGALLLTSAGACGPAGDDDVPGITDQQGDDDGDDQGDDGDQDDRDDQGGDDGDD